MAVLAAFDSTPIYRLKSVFRDPESGISEKHHERLQYLKNTTATGNNYSSVRALLASWSGPRVPFLGMYLTDIVFTTDGNPDSIKSPTADLKLVNFVKCTQLAK